MNAAADDETLFSAWMGGDRDAGARLVERHYDAIVRFFRTKAGDHTDDLVQRTFLAVSEAGERYRAAASFRAFLFGIARNVFLEFLRTCVRDRLRDPDFGVSSVVDLRTGAATRLGRHDEQQLLLACLQQLPVELQVAVELYYWEGISVPELASIQGVPPGTVKSRLFRARALLREALERSQAISAEKSLVSAVFDTWTPPAPDDGYDG
ncbi:MAG: RNA polymerase sigma factor [Bradymonadia bacterium]